MMCEGKLLNSIIEILEKDQNVKIWTSQNEIKPETLQKLKCCIHEYRDREINNHVINMFGANSLLIKKN